MGELSLCIPLTVVCNSMLLSAIAHVLEGNAAEDMHLFIIFMLPLFFPWLICLIVTPNHLEAISVFFSLSTCQIRSGGGGEFTVPTWKYKYDGYVLPDLPTKWARSCPKGEVCTVPQNGEFNTVCKELSDLNVFRALLK